MKLLRSSLKILANSKVCSASCIIISEFPFLSLLNFLYCMYVFRIKGGFRQKLYINSLTGGYL
jgi:hypothetical protein